MSPLWNPDREITEKSHLRHYMSWLKTYANLDFEDYHALWSWSVDNHERFWESLYHYFQIIDHGKYTSVTDGSTMPGVRWFEGSKINYAEHVFRKATTERPAVLYCSESFPDIKSLSWEDLSRQVVLFQQYLISHGVQKGDRVAAYLTNTPHATIAMLATISIGAIWSSCSPDFGVSSVIDRFKQISPSILIGIDGYTYNGKRFDRVKELEEIRNQLPECKDLVIVPFMGDIPFDHVPNHTSWTDIMNQDTDKELTFVPVDFNDPIWILYSSGTTGKPKAITHSHGGMLLEHLKYLHFHNDVHEGEKFFWYSTTGWMMWNFVHASLLAGATIVLYEGSAAFPGLSFLWEMASKAGVHHFGTSAPYIVACMKAGLDIKKTTDLSALRSIGSTGSPLPPEGFVYVYEHIHDAVWLTSMSGGTDVCTAFVGGNVLLPVYQGEIQCRTLGCALYAYNENGNLVPNGQVGEMVITKAMPCMPIYFWNDDHNAKYRDSYFDMFENVWRHGDWINITEHQGIIILGRSDATLNRHGVRIGTAEIYGSLNKIEEIKDSLVVNLEMEGGKHYMPLFVVLNDGQRLTPELIQKIAKQLRADYSPRHVPDEVYEVADLPYTISGKKLETPVKKILLGMAVDTVSNKDAMRNPESLEYFKSFKIPNL
jgi:acetoacetyl-CoA synthetase